MALPMISNFRECPPYPRTAGTGDGTKDMISADMHEPPYFAAFSGAGAGAVFSKGRPLTETICKSLSALKDL